MNKTALSLLLCDALRKLKRRTKALQRMVWEPHAFERLCNRVTNDLVALIGKEEIPIGYCSNQNNTITPLKKQSKQEWQWL